jgi:hypothetical protein
MERGTQTEDFWEWVAEEDIWVQEGEITGGMEELYDLYP